MKVVDKTGKTVRLNDRRRTLLEKLEPASAERFCKALNEYPVKSELGPFRVEVDE